MTSKTNCALATAGILGMLQGLVTFVGTLVIAFDRFMLVIFKSYCSSIIYV